MRLPDLLISLSFAACTSGPSQSDSITLFADTSSAMESTLDAGVTQARTVDTVDPLVIDFTGPCASGGTAAITGSFTGYGTTSDAASFDVTMTFTACAAPAATLDGTAHWTSSAAGSLFTGSETGSLDVKQTGGSEWSCDFDLTFSIDPGLSSTIDGSFCGNTLALQTY